MNAETNEFDSDHPDINASSRDILVAVVLSLVMITLGGYVCGLFINELGSVGSISLWAVGFLAGLIATKLIREKSLIVAGLLVLACIGAFVVSETLWIQWNIKDVNSFPAALAKFPVFGKEFKVPAFIAGIFTLFGGHAAYRHVAPTQ